MPRVKKLPPPIQSFAETEFFFKHIGLQCRQFGEEILVNCDWFGLVIFANWRFDQFQKDWAARDIAHPSEFIEDFKGLGHNLYQVDTHGKVFRVVTPKGRLMRLVRDETEDIWKIFTQPHLLHGEVIECKGNGVAAMRLDKL